MSLVKYRSFLLLIFLIIPCGIYAEKPVLERLYGNTPACEAWVDSVMRTLDRQARVGQLFMPVAHAGRQQGWPEKIASWVESQQIGGLFFDRGNLYDQVEATNRAQSLSKVPLLVGADAEWGLAMRIEGTLCFPHNTMLGAITDTSLIYEYGLEMARQCRRIGVQVNFAPDADVNNNPANPVINTRSFGSDPERVAVYASRYAQGLEVGGVMSVMKHFPGHGNTVEDSHEQLAIVKSDMAAMDTVELLPFRQLINAGISGAMVGHLSVPAYEKNPQLPASQSPAIVDGLLKKSMHFEGLVFTDALVMKGASSTYSGLNCVRALLAGNDILLSPANLIGDIRAVVSAVERGILSDSLIDEKCRKVLKYKYILGLNHYEPADTASLLSDLAKPQTEALNHRLYMEAMTLLRNEKDYVPFRHLDTVKTAVIVLEQPKDNAFVKTLKLYQENIDVYSLIPGNELDKANLDVLFNKYDRVIVGVYANNLVQRNWLKRLEGLDHLCLCFFSPLYTLYRHGEILTQADAVLCAYESGDMAQEMAAQALFGGHRINGILPAPVAAYYPQGAGLQTEKTRLSYGVPEEEGMSTQVLSRIDSIVNDAMTHQAFPGCQILVAKHGNIVWNKSYGWTDIDRYRPVEDSDVYDLASLTKAIVTTSAIMSLCEQGKIMLDDPVSKHLPALRETDKEDFSYRKMLYHEARLTPFIPFYQYLIDSTTYGADRFLSFHQDSVHTVKFDESSWAPSSFDFNADLVSFVGKEPFTLQVAENLYVHHSFRDSVTKIICDSKLLTRSKYAYSDLGYMLMGFAAETILGESLDVWAEKELFAPLGAYTTTFLPLKKLGVDRIVPTALDTSLRKQLIHGFPHDEAAAFLGGVSGNAGLFSSANDLAKFLQMLLEEGTYGGHRYLEPSTVRYFTSSRSKLSRRMLGFDAAEINPAKVQPVSSYASLSTYGHIGFTGTCFWIDPVNEMVYIFLSNRIHPDRTNTALGRMDIRPKIQDVIYQAWR